MGRPINNIRKANLRVKTNREGYNQNRMFGIFHDAGYKGLYGGLGGDAIKQLAKGVPEKEQLMDRMVDITDSLPINSA